MIDKILFILILVFICLLIVKIINIYNLKKLNTISTENLYNKCKTGDIIYFRWNTVKMLNELYSKYTHIGMIVELNDEKYVFETHLKGDAIDMGVETGGVHLHKLIDRINNYNGNMYYSELKYNIDDDILNKFINNIETYKKIEFQDSYENHILNNCLLKRLYQKCINVNTQKKFCSEFVMFCLYELEILKNDCSYCVFPDDFKNLKVDDNLIFDTVERIDKNDIKYTEIIILLHYCITFFVIFGGLIGIIFNNLDIIKFHILFNILVIVHWLTNNNKCVLSEISYENNEKNNKYTDDIISNIFQTKLNDFQLLIISYLVIIIPMIISVIILFCKIKWIKN
jgi:hypothetical protein